MARYSLAFPADTNSIPYAIYIQLRKLKITDAALDHGTLVINSNGTSCPKRTASTCIAGKGDHKITSEEVFDTALDLRERDFPFWYNLRKNHDFKIPWIWNTLQPIMPREDMSRFREYTTVLKTSLKQRDLIDGTPEFRDALALGIYYYVVSPKLDFVGEWDRFNIAEKELTALGWTEIKDYLKTKGGVFTARGKGTSSVLEGVEQGELQSIQIAILLYSALRAAGISAVFTQGEGAAVGDPNLLDVDIYTCVQVSTGNGFRMMDPYSMQPNAHYAKFVAISPRQMLGAYQLFLAGKNHEDLVNLVNSANPTNDLVNSKLEEMRKHLESASMIDPRSPLVHGMFGMYWMVQNKLSAADIEIKNAIALSPQLPRTYIARAGLSVQRNEFDKAIQDATHAMTLAPSRYDFVLTRGEVYAFKGEWDKAITDYLQAYRMNNNQGQGELTSSIAKATHRLWSDKGREALKKQFATETGLKAEKFEVEKFEADIIGSHLSWKMGRPKTATVLLVELLQSLPHPETYSEPVRKELHRMMAQLPPDMREMKDVKTAIARVP